MYKRQTLDNATAEYKDFVEMQIDQLLKDTEGFRDTLKAGNLEEAKKQYHLIRMAYERSEPIAETFGEAHPSGNLPNTATKSLIYICFFFSTLSGEFAHKRNSLYHLSFGSISGCYFVGIRQT